MGYYVTMSGELRLPQANKDEAYQRMCALNDHDNLKRGFRRGGENDGMSPRPQGMDYHPGKWFSWMDCNYPATCSDAKAIFEKLGFETEDADNGDLFLTGYNTKTGQEDLFLDAIHDLLEGTAEWQGEDGERWRISYPDGTLWEARINWEAK